ncbi:GntR family transcriptional regulator [Paucisalibacillus sp. EB02]|uniref:GntR family transcriptional regulator n=1 Tax=Paucisalibacillus sp. EB02 TaxID=1347087 RepID=UPI0004BBF4E0|nr:GntR family transcriptional regulator [Paucisalibacillus sp. EB02]
MNIKINSRDPVYIQVIQYFKEQIATGVLEPGQEISSRRELANKLKINPNTAQRAYKEMEEQGLIFTEGNLPSRITKNEVIIKQVREELILEAVNTFIASVQSINVPLEEAIGLIKKNYEKNPGGQEGNQ